MNRHIKFPHIGLRIIKSSLAVFICLVLDIFRGQTGVPFYSAIAAVLCIQPLQEEGLKAGWSRICGTFIGAFWGTIILFINLRFIPEPQVVLRYALMSLGVIPVIYTAVLLKKHGSVFISCIVLLSINVNHIGDENPYLFIFNRVLDTLLGVGIALLINSLEIPRKRNRDVLFVAEIEDTLLADSQKLKPYDKFMLNRMIEKGALFTFSTYSSPASMLELCSGIHLNQPVILLDGAALYDVKDNLYLRKISIPHATARELMAYMKNHDFHCFATAIVENTLLTYIGEFKNNVEAQIYERLNRSPYWNYIHSEIPQGQDVSYFMIVDTVERITRLREELEAQPFFGELRANCYVSREDPAYLHMKLYSRRATPKKMIAYLQQELGVEKVVTFGNMDALDAPNASDGPEVSGQGHGAGGQMVKEMDRLFQPYFWRGTEV